MRTMTPTIYQLAYLHYILINVTLGITTMYTISKVERNHLILDFMRLIVTCFVLIYYIFILFFTGNLV